MVVWSAMAECVSTSGAGCWTIHLEAGAICHTYSPRCQVRPTDGATCLLSYLTNQLSVSSSIHSANTFSPLEWPTPRRWNFRRKIYDGKLLYRTRWEGCYAPLPSSSCGGPVAFSHLARLLPATGRNVVQFSWTHGRTDGKLFYKVG